MLCQDPLGKVKVTVLVLVISLILSSSPVWTGFACLENPCFHGICIDYLDMNSSHQCYCRNGFTGYSCQINWDECRSNPCMNGGLCTDGIASFNCSCPDNFAGALCEYDLSTCDQVFPCHNNGTCTVDPASSNGTFMCICPPGFSGPQCEGDVSICNISENVCRNGGRCVDGLGVSFSCECESGWSGRTCEVEVDECESQPCQNGGICVDKVDDYSCACPFGYTGKGCESKLKICEENPCLNGAFCLHDDVDDAKLTCYCVPDYHGTLCELKYDDCDPLPRCFNGGTCIDGVGDFTCSCPPAFFGPTCQCTLDNMASIECQVNETLVPSVSEIPSGLSRTLEETQWLPPVTSAIQLSPTFVPILSSKINGEDLTSSRAKPLGSAFVTPHQTLLVSQSEFSSVWSPVLIEGSSEVFVSHFSGDLQGTVYFTTYLPMETVVLESPSARPSSSLVFVDVSRSEVLISYYASLLESHSVAPEVEGSVATARKSELMSADVEMSRILTISEVMEQTASVDASSRLVISEGLGSSSYEVPKKDIIGVSSLPVRESDKVDMSSSLELSSSATLMSSIVPSLIPLSSDLSDFLLISDYMTPGMTERVPKTLEPSPSGTTEEPTASFTLVSSESFASSWVSEELVSSVISVFPSISEGLEESGAAGVSFTAAVQSSEIVPSLLNVSQLPDHLLTPPLIISTSLDTPLSLTPLAITATELPSTILQHTPLHTPSFIYPSPSIPESASLLVVSSSQMVEYEVTEGPARDLCKGYCHNDAKCVSTSIQPQCICTFKFRGERCETRREKFGRVSFTGDSFIGYRVPNESINRIEVGVQVATNYPEGILFYTAVEKLYALIFIEGGHVTLHFSCGEQSMHFVETHTRVDNGFNFTLEFNMELVVRGASELHCVGQVNVNESYVMRGEQTLSLRGPHDNPMQMVYLGGVPPTSIAVRNDELIAIIPGFRGCLYTLSINQEGKDLFDDAVEAQQVSDCSAFECATNPCFGSAKCVPFDQFPFWQCLCPPGFEGVKCQIRVCDAKNPCQNGATCTYPVEDSSNSSSSLVGGIMPVCLCPLGFSGRLCQSKINITKPSFKPALGFDYSAFIAYEPIPHFVDWAQLKFHFVTPNVTQVALLFYSGFHRHSHGGIDELSENYSDMPEESHPDTFEFQGDSGTTTTKIIDFFALSFVHGYIALTWNLGSGTQRIITPGRIDKRLNVHTLFAGRSGRQAWLKVDGMRNVSGKSPGPFHRLNVNSELYVGGHEVFRLEGLPHDLPLHKGFHGCIFDFGFRVKNRLYLPRATRGRNVQNCYEEDC